MIVSPSDIASRLKALLALDEGQELVEYAFLLLLIALAIVSAVPPVASAVIPLYDKLLAPF